MLKISNFLVCVLLVFLSAPVFSQSYPVGDLNGDYKVNITDLELFVQQWMDLSDCSGLGCADLDGVNDIDFNDFALLSQNWLVEYVLPLSINEFMAANNNTLEDPDEIGETPDWLELYNSSGHTIELGGMYLTDNNDNPIKWQIPSGVSIGAGDYVIFYADDDDEQGDYHTNFKLDADGDDLYLYDSDGFTLIDSIDFNDQYGDVSYGRYPDGTFNWIFMGNPTPDATNVDSYVGQVEDTSFSVDRGFYEEPFQVRIACDTEGAIIRYTLDGSEPTDSHGSIYNPANPIQITGTTVLRAIAYKPGWLSSNTDTQTYIFIADAISQSSTPPPGWPTSSVNGQRIDYQMDPDITTDPAYSELMDDALLAIPSICINTDLDNLFDPSIGLYVNCGDYGTPGWERGPAWRRPASVELINPDGSKGFQINAGLGMRGITSCRDSNPKHAFRLFFSSEYGGGALEFPLFGGEGADRFENLDLRCAANYSWNFDGSSANQYFTYIREVFSRDLQGQMGQPYTRSRYYHLYLNGLYWGLYQSQERANSNHGQAYLGGDSDDYDVVKPNRYWPRSMECTDGTFDAYERLWQACLDGFDTDQKYYQVQGLNVDGTPNPAYEKLVDVSNIIDYMITIYYSGDFDAPICGWDSDRTPNNFFGLYNRVNPDGFKFFRHDGEHSMGVNHDLYRNRVGPLTHSYLMYFNRGCTPQLWTYPICIGFNPQTIHQHLIVHPEYKLLFADHVHKFLFNEGPMVPENAQNIFLQRAQQIDMAIIGESARWGDAQTNPPRTKDNWLDEVDWVVDTYIPARTDIVLNQLRNAGWYPSVVAPEFYINGSPQHGGLINPPDSLTISAPAGTVYYTLDGTDPRTPLTGTPRGSTYSSAISLTQSTKVMARAYSGGTWSALSEAVYSGIDIKENLRITELMYHPADPNTEYIELQNIGDSAINLMGTKFTEGIHFIFPDVTLAAGGYIVVVNDLSAFTVKYGGGINIAGQYSGRLDNNGEKVRLEDPIGNVIHDFNYKDGWRNITDGEGYSLTINDAKSTDLNVWADEDGWSASTYLNGTPGEGDNGPNWGDIVINEVLTHQDSYPEDWIELHNTTGSAIDITGYYLSDSDLDLRKYELPSTTIPANGYVVFTENDHFGAYFAISENSDEVFLTGKDDGFGNLTGYRQKEEFGAAERDVSFGRHLKSTGTYNFVAMSYQTPGTTYVGAANAYPKVGPVVITEIMYRPEKFWGDWEAEYIELCNISDSTINLYDTNNVTWKITDGIQFEFPAGISIDPGEYILLVRNTTAFNNEFGTIPGVQMFQWTSGKLDNDGEKVEISMPGEIDELSVQHYIRIDRVNYSNGSHPEEFDGETDPWPDTADGTGYSLTKVDYNLYGNDPNAWGAWAPSPG